MLGYVPSEYNQDVAVSVIHQSARKLLVLIVQVASILNSLTGANVTLKTAVEASKSTIVGNAMVFRAMNKRNMPMTRIMEQE